MKVKLYLRQWKGGGHGVGVKDKTKTQLEKKLKPNKQGIL